MNFKEYTKKSLILLVLLQPFLDIYFLYVPPVTNWVPFSPATLIRIFLVAIIAGLYIWSSVIIRRIDLRGFIRLF